MRALALLLLAGCVASTPRVLPLPKGCASRSSLPLSVAMDESAADYRPQFNVAMKDWSRALGRPAFVWALAAPGEADVLIVVGATRAEREVGNAPARCARGRVLTTIVLRQGLDVLERTAFGSHELGHALGLGHSTNQQSIMQAVVDADLMGSWTDTVAPMHYRVTENDARLANALHPDRGP